MDFNNMKQTNGEKKKKKNKVIIILKINVLQRLYIRIYFCTQRKNSKLIGFSCFEIYASAWPRV